MRDIWDKERIKKQAEKEMLRNRGTAAIPGAVKKEYRDYLKVKEKSLTETRRYLLDYLARKKAFLERKGEIAKTFADYESRLGDAGFSKI